MVYDDLIRKQRSCQGPQKIRRIFVMVKQTAGRDALGEFAPKFAELNDDVLFGEVWSPALS